MQSPQYFALPVELIIRVLRFLPFKDIVICSGVSRQFREVIETSSTLEYILELGLCGLVESDPGNFTTAERLHRLREREYAWSTLTWKSSKKVPVDQKYIFWELCGGFFIGGYIRKNTTLRYRRGLDMIDIFDLESHAQEEPAKRIQLEKTFYNFCVDPGQDLLILVDEPPTAPKFWFMHIRSLSSGLAHPKAAQPITEVSVAHDNWPSYNDFPGAVDVQVLECMVLYTQHRGPGGSGGISVINWNTGTEVFRSLPVLPRWCCTLLSDTELLIAWRSAYGSQPSLDLYRLDGPSKWTAPRISYLLPFKDARRIWHSAYCYSPASCYNTEGAPGKWTNTSFTYPATPQLLAFRFTSTASVENGHGTASVNLDMFLNVDLLRRYTISGHGAIIPWEVWGPPTTRTFKAVLPFSWRRAIKGYRAVLPGSNTVLDFNNNLWAEGDSGVVTQTSQILLDNSVGLSITSALPYREIRPSQPFGYKHVLLGENIVCVEEDPKYGGRTKAIHVLSFLSQETKCHTFPSQASINLAVTTI
ncbi:hypothetical protein K439DRAFT_1629060 [Ramaria rubella]|nr:hypothetical protein K439DRAFT_1629060 [Ramaria rubella]